MNKLISKLKNLFIEDKENKVMSEKTKVRKYIRQRRQLISEVEKSLASQEVFDKIEQLTEFEDAQTILLYWSMPDELPTHNFVVKWSKRKLILLPVVKDGLMLIKPFSGADDLKQSSYGIWEPDSQKEYLSKIDLVIVPAVAFDKNRNRLGHGKGYYDKFLVNRSTVKIGIGFDFQVLDKIPVHSYDIKMDKVITPSFTIV